MRTKDKSVTVPTIGTTSKLEIQFFSRKKNPAFFSIEELFEAIQQRLAPHLAFQNHIMPYESTGIKNRWLNGLFAKEHKGEINHITGDIHYLALFLPRRNTILTIHDCGELDKMKGIKKFILWLFWFYLPVRRLQYITVISEATRTHLLRYVKTDPNKIVVIPNCLIGKYSISERPFNTEKPVILLVGITPNKNIERITAALQNIPCTLMVIGKLNEVQVGFLSRYQIEFRYKSGLTRQEVISEFAACDMLVFPSLLEGFGLPIIEAQASGKPVVTSNIDPMLSTAGGGACFVDPYSINDIRRGVLKVIRDENYRRYIIDRGIENSKRFDPDQVAKQYIEVYKEVARDNRSPHL